MDDNELKLDNQRRVHVPVYACDVFTVVSVLLRGCECVCELVELYVCLLWHIQNVIC